MFGLFEGKSRQQKQMETLIETNTLMLRELRQLSGSAVRLEAKLASSAQAMQGLVEMHRDIDKLMQAMEIGQFKALKQWIEKAGETHTKDRELIDELLARWKDHARALETAVG